MQLMEILAMRDRAYYRKMRAKHIKRKKRIAEYYYGFGWAYPFDGMYSKGKVHCSCRMCRSRDYNGKHIKTRQEIKSEDDAVDQIEFYDFCLYDH